MPFDSQAFMVVLVACSCVRHLDEYPATIKQTGDFRAEFDVDAQVLKPMNSLIACHFAWCIGKYRATL